MKTQELIDNFLISYITNNMPLCSDCLSDSISVQYSNIGQKEGRQQVIDALKWDEDFDVQTVTTTNAISYQNGNRSVTGLMAHHMLSYEKNNEMFPFVFGGKYVFTVNTEENAIENITFVLEYQGENTIYMKDKWKFAGDVVDYQLIKRYFSFDELYKNINCMSDRDERLRQLCSMFFWLLDIGDTEALSPLISDDFTISREPYVGNTVFSADKDGLASFIQCTKSYYQLNQYSICFNQIYTEAEDTVLDASHLTPHRLGTKKLNYLTKYHSFFDEDVTVHVNPEGKIKSVVFKRSADVHYNGFILLKH